MGTLSRRQAGLLRPASSTRCVSFILFAAWPIHCQYGRIPFVGTTENHQNHIMHVYRIKISMRGRAFNVTQSEDDDSDGCIHASNTRSTLIIMFVLDDDDDDDDDDEG